MRYSYKNCKIRLNSSGFIADKVDFSIQSDNTSFYKAEKKYPQGPLVANAAVGGTLNIGYFITGEDPLRDFIYAEDSAITGNFAGLYFGSGYLTSYSMDLIPNQSAHVSARINFFDQLTGTFSPITENLPSVDPLNSCDIVLNGTGLVDLTTISRASLNYSNDVSANYYVSTETGQTNIKPNRIVFGKRKLTSQVVLGNLDGTLGIYGNYGTLAITLKDKAGDYKTEYVIKGSIRGKSIGVSSDGYTKNSLEITQEAPSEIATITDFHPESGYPGDLITVSGTNFHLAPSIFLEKYELRPITFKSATELQFSTPNAAIPSGNLIVIRPDLDITETFRTNDFSWQELGGNFRVIYMDPSVGGTFVRT
tara:strand:+ start:767 stop:1864 length:1098 start_codon:yes stop_codon:yes gene_type:complete